MIVFRLLALLLFSWCLGFPSVTAQNDRKNEDEQSFYPLFGNIPHERRILGNSENVRMASQAIARRSTMVTSESGPQDISETRFEDIGSGPDGGRLLRFHKEHDEGLSNSQHQAIKVTRKIKKSSTKASKFSKTSKKAFKASKKTESPKTPNNKAICTDLVAENGNWKNWYTDITTFAPIFRPATDDELRGIINNSKRFGCTIRMMGARHSEDGMVMQRKEKDVVVISLASHTTQIEGWHDSIDATSSTFRIGAGNSWYDVSALIRPHGFVLNSRTAGPFFSVGGVIANMVHGGGRKVGFMHDDIVKMLVLTSDGEFHEVEGDELKYWRSSAGQLGMIVAVQMKMHSEAIPFISGIDPTTGVPVIDQSKGGLAMEKERTIFASPANPEAFNLLIQQLSQKVFQTNALYDNAQFFYNFYTNTLAEYRANFSGPRFSGATGDFGNAEKAKSYDDATKRLAELNAEAAFTGGTLNELSEDYLCDIFCVPPTGPAGDGSQCIPIPSTFVPDQRLCKVPLEASAALSASTLDVLDGSWTANAFDSNDGYFDLSQEIVNFDSVIAFVPARAFAIAFATWYNVNAKAVSDELPNTTFYPNGNLEFRFMNPLETAVLNPIPVIEEIKLEFDKKYNLLYGGVDSAFDMLLPPLPPGVSDGWIVIELTNLKNVYTADVSKYLFAMQQAWSSMPTNPLLPYGDGVVKSCDVMKGVLPCSGPPASGTQCCNPPIPSKLVHLGKGWGYAFDPSTTPTTGKLQPFKDPNAILNMYSTGSKQDSISDFNAKRSELDADVFSGGAMMRWLDESFPNSDYEVRKLVEQNCGSMDFVMDPNKECISDACVDSICV